MRAGSRSVLVCIALTGHAVALDETSNSVNSQGPRPIWRNERSAQESQLKLSSTYPAETSVKNFLSLQKEALRFRKKQTAKRHMMKKMFSLMKHSKLLSHPQSVTAIPTISNYPFKSDVYATVTYSPSKSLWKNTLSIWKSAFHAPSRVKGSKGSNAVTAVTATDAFTPAPYRQARQRRRRTVRSSVQKVPTPPAPHSRHPGGEIEDDNCDESCEDEFQDDSLDSSAQSESDFFSND